MIQMFSFLQPRRGPRIATLLVVKLVLCFLLHAALLTFTVQTKKNCRRAAHCTHNKPQNVLSSSYK